MSKKLLSENASVKSDILIVDDEVNNLTVLRNVLSEAGHNVRPALSGELALKAIENRIPDLILLDINMPDGLSGHEVSRALQSKEETKNIPVLFISAFTDTANKIKAFKAGGLDYITKPFQAEEVIARVGTHLTLSHVIRKLEERNNQLQKEIGIRKKAESELAKANIILEGLANTDRLTGLANRRRFDEMLENEWRRAKRSSDSIGLIMCDVDYFKRYNDCYGHPAGDDCLQKVTAAIAATVKRPGDLAARYGGEEFAVILAESEIIDAATVANRILEAVQNLKIPHEKSDAAPIVTLSIGVAVAMPDATMTPENLVEQADAALYQAKENGRNQVVCSREEANLST